MKRIAFIKFAGLAAGGTERWLQMMAANLPKDEFEIDDYYCDAAPYVGSDYKHTTTDTNRLRYMQEHNVNLIKFNVGSKDITKPTHDWVDTNFWDLFDENKYDLVQTAKAGPAEYPYHLVKLPVIEFVALDAGVDFSPNIVWSIHLSNWQRKNWIKKGGDQNKSSVISIPAEEPSTQENLRETLNIPKEALVAGFHQRDDDNIFSMIPLEAFSHLKNPDWHFIIMGASRLYREQAQKLDLKNVHFLNHGSNSTDISKFLNTLDIFAHGRKDGETFGTVFAEAMMHGLPCLSHWSPIANAQPETMGPAGLFVKDLDEYTDKLRDLFSNNELRARLASKAKPHAQEHYSLESCVKKLSLIYFDVFKQIERSPNWLQKQKIKMGVKQMNPMIIIRKLYRLLIKIRKKLRTYFQSQQANYKKHHGQYADATAIEKHQKTYQKFEAENLFNSQENKLGILLKQHPNIRNTTVDIGCGSGWLAAKLSKDFKQVIAIEPSQAAIDIAKALFPQLKHTNIEWITGLAEDKLKSVSLTSPTLFVTGCVFSHLTDDAVSNICSTLNKIAPKNSILSFGECWGEESHEFMWHVRTKEWWQNALPGWQLDFHGPTIQDHANRHKGFHGVKIS